MNTTETVLSVNLNKVATLRNTRSLGIPSVTRAAKLCLVAGAGGITVHPRPDERHIRQSDIAELKDVLVGWPDREFNIEGNPFHNLMDVAKVAVPDQLTFVPDSVDQPTSDHGWRFPQDANRLRSVIEQGKALGCRISLFMDPLPEQMAAVKEVGADRVELYTGSYAVAWGTAEQDLVLAQFKAAAEAAVHAGLEINAGHDLNRDNLTEFLQVVPGVKEVSIGHALIADALELGYAEAVKSYLARIPR